MPGRYLEDSNTHCNYFTESEIVPKKDSTWVAWTVTLTGLTTVGSATITPGQPGIILHTGGLRDGLALSPVTVTPGALMEVDLSVLGATADYTLTISEGTTMLGSSPIPTGTSGVVPVLFTPSGSSVTLTIGR